METKQLVQKGYDMRKDDLIVITGANVCQEYWLERGMKTFIPSFHNVYGSHGIWDGGREKAPATIWISTTA
jgi:hypothetical protein